MYVTLDVVPRRQNLIQGSITFELIVSLLLLCTLYLASSCYTWSSSCWQYMVNQINVGTAVPRRLHSRCKRFPWKKRSCKLGWSSGKGSIVHKHMRMGNGMVSHSSSLNCWHTLQCPTPTCTRTHTCGRICMCTRTTPEHVWSSLQYPGVGSHLP